MNVLDGEGELEPCQKPPFAKVRGRSVYAGAHVPGHKFCGLRSVIEVENLEVLHGWGRWPDRKSVV